MTTAPERGADADDPTGRNCLVDRIARRDTCVGAGEVRVSSSNAEVNQSYPATSRLSNGVLKACVSRFQSERGLDSAERSPEGEPEARASGKSDGTRSDRSETSGGAVAVVAVASEAVCCGAAGCRSTESLLIVETGNRRRVLCPECLSSFVRREAR